MNEDILLGLKLAITNTEQELTNEIDSLVTAAQKKAKAVQLDLNIDEGLKKLEKTLNGKLKGVNFNPELKKFFEAFSSGDIKDIGKAYEEINNKALLLTKNLTDAQLKLMDGWSGEQVNKFVKRIIKANEDIEKATKKQSKYENIPEYVKKTRASENSIKKTLQGKKNKSDEEILDQFERAGLDVSKITKKELSSFTYYEKLLSYQKELIENDKALANPKTQKEADAQIENAQKLIKVTELLGRSREQLIEIGKKLNQNEDFTIDEVQNIDSNLATKYAQEWNKIVDKAIAEIKNNINSNLAEELEETSSKYLSAKVERNTEAINQQKAKRAKAIAPVDKEDVGTTEQYTEALNGIDNELDDVQEGATTTAKSVEQLGEEFKEVKKYAVEAEEAIAKLRVLETIKDEDGHRIEDLDDSQIKDIIGYYTRLRSLNDIDKLNEPFLSIFNNIDDNYTDLIFEAFDNLDLISPGKTDQFTALIEAMTQKQFEAINEYEEQTVKKAQEAQEHVAEEISKPIKEVVEDTATGNGEAAAIPISIDAEDIKKQLQETIADFNAKFSDALNNSINDFSDRFSNIDYYQALEPLRRELLNIVQQFKNSLKDLGIENSDLNKLYETLDAWNISSHISTEDDRERLMLGNIKSGKTSVAVSGSEASISGELQQRLLTEVSKRIDGNISDVFDMWIHSHPLRDFLPNSKTRTTGADIGFSYGDLQSELNHYFEQGIKKMLVTNNGKYSMLDFSKISKEILEKFISQLAANLEKSGNFSIETDKIFKDGKGKIKDVAINRDAYVKDGVADLDKKSELINNAILETINSSKKLKQIIFETGDIADLKIDEVVQDEKNLANQSEELLSILNQIRNILNDMSTSGGGNSNLSGIFNIHLIADVDYLIERIQRTLDDHDFKIKVNLASGQSLDESDEGVINTEGFSADRTTDSLHALNYEKSENIELNAKLRKNANESAKALANEAEKAEAADKALTELNKRKRANNKLNEEKPEPKKNESNLSLDKETESTTLLSLLDPLEKIKTAIIEKNNLFLSEEEVVKNTVWGEINNLSLLLSCIEEIIQAIKNLNSQFGNLSFDSLTQLMKQLKSNKTNNTNIEGIVENLSKLAKGLNELKIDDNGFIDSVNRIINASKQLKDVVKDAKTVNKANKKAGNKSKKEKDPAIKFYKDRANLESKRLNLIDKRDNGNGLTIKEAGELAGIEVQLKQIDDQIQNIDQSTDAAKQALQDYNNTINITTAEIKGANEERKKVADEKVAKNTADELQSQIEKYNKLQNKAKEVFENSDKYVESFRKSLKSISEEDIDLTNIDRIKDKIKELENSLDEKTLKANLEGTYTKLLSFYEKIQKQLATEPHMASDIKMQYRALADEIDNLIKTGNVLPGTLNKITKAFIELNAQDAKTKGFLRSVADRTREMNVKFLGQFFSFYDIIRYGREIFGVIEELDTSLVDLRKTTAMTTSELDKYYYESNNIAKQMGVTTNEIIQQSAAWSRLGYNTAEQTKQMAQLSSKFASISPGMDSDMAQEGLVSIMKAWDIETENVERKILDNINTLGNKFAETNADIVTGMEKSASTFAALGQSSEDAFALFTGAQEVMQNAEVVGTALKTLSLRIRGYDEETEQLSEDLVDVNGKVADLTKTTQHAQGISLFTDASQQHYRSMVDYLGEIADRWDEIDEKSRTQLLDKLFGKRGASVGSAILGNFDQVRKALEEMENAAGSADAEMDIIRDSVEFKLNALKETWVGYAQELLQRDDIGQIIDKLIEGSESLQDTIDALAPAVEVLINLLSNLVEVLGAVAEGFGPLTPILAGVGGFAFADHKFDLLKNVDNTQLDARGEKIKNWWNGLFDFEDPFGKLNDDSIPIDIPDSIEAIDDVIDDVGENTEEVFDTLPAKIEDVGEKVGEFGEKASEAGEALAEGAKEGQSAMDVLKGKFKSIMTIVTNPAFLGVAAAVAAIAIFKKVNTSVADVQATIDKTSQKIIELESEIEKLNKLDYRNTAQEQRLRLLQDELEIQKQLLELEEKRKAREEVQFDLEDLFTGDNYTVNMYEEDTYIKDKFRFDNINKKYQNLIEKREELDKKIANAQTEDEQNDYIEDRIKLDDKLQQSQQNLADQLEYLTEKQTQYQADIIKLTENLSKLDERSSAYTKTLENINYRKKYLEEITPIINNIKQELERSVNGTDFIKGALDNFDGLENKLVDLYKQGKLSKEEIQALFNGEGTTSTLSNLLTNQILEALKASGVEADALYRVIQNIADPKRQWRRNVQGDMRETIFGTIYFGDPDQELKDAGIDLENETHLQAYLDLKTETPEGEYAEWSIETWIKKIQEKITENPLKVDGHLSVSDALEGYKVDENTTGQDKLDEYYDTVSNIQDVINKINTGDYTAMDLNQWRTEYDLVGESADEMVEELKKVEEESRKAVIEVIDKLIETNPNDAELIKSLKQIKQGIIDIREEAEKKMNFDPGVDKLSQFSSALDSLKDSYIGLFKDGDQIDASSLMSIREVFGELGDDYADFEKAVLSGSDDIDGAFDKLVSAYAHQKNILSEVNEENKQYYITLLKDKGVVNAEEVVTAALNNQLEVQKFEMDALSASSKDLQGQTDKNSQKFLEEANMSNFAKVQLADLVAKQNIFNNQSLDVSQKITALESLAKAYFGASAAAEFLDSVDRGYSTSNEKYRKSPEEAWQDLWEKQIKKVETPKIDFDYDATKAKDASGGGGSEETAETFDWIETKIQRLERDITNLGKTADATYKTWAERTVALGQEMEKVNEQISLQETAYNAYMAKAESVGLSAQYKKLVQSGALKIDEITDETLKEQIQNYSDWYQKALDAKDKVDDLKQSLAELARQKFDNISAQFDDLISDIDHFVKFINAQLTSVETIGKIGGKSFYEALIAQEQQRVNELTAELAQLQNALAEGLASGAIEYGSQMWAEMKKQIFSVEEAIWDANNAILEFEQKLKQVAKQNFDDLVSQFENAINILTSKMDLTDKIIGMVQNTGHIVSKEYYNALINASDQNVKNLKKKYDELQKVFDEAVANGDITPYSDEWYEMKEKIEAVKGEIIDAANALIEYKNALRQIEWDLFDRGQTRLEQLVSESQFLIDLYSKYPLFDKETGEITDKGMATRGLLVQNYETYKQQAAQLADEIERLKSELEADPKNTTLIDRLRELEEAERSAILASEGVKESLRDLLENEINALIDALDKLVNKYIEALNKQKDLRDYSKTIDNLNKNILSLEKQALAYSGDDSEENRARMQKINANLKDAREQLEETEFDRYIKETQEILQSLLDDLKTWAEEKLADLNWVLEQAIESTNLNAETIRSQIEQTGIDVGYVYTDEFSKIWENMTASDSLFSEQRDILASTGQVCTDIQAAVMELPTDQALASYLEGETLAIVTEISSVDNAVGAVQTAIGETNTALAQIQSRIQEYNASVLSAMASAQAAAERAQQAANAAQQTANEAKNKAESGDRTSSGSGNHGVKGVVYTQAGMPITIDEPADSKSAAEARKSDLERMYGGPYKSKNHLTAYAKGGLIGKDKDNPLDFLAQQLGEDHMVAAKEGERILTVKQNENFEKLANAFSSLSSEDMAKYSILTGNKMIGKMPTLQMPTLRSMEQGGNTEINGGISINLPNVTNKAEFVEWLKTDGQIEKIVQSMTLGKLQGRNSYDKMKY